MTSALSTDHAAYLTASAIDLDVAERAGVRTINTPDELNEELRDLVTYMAKANGVPLDEAFPGLLFVHQRPSGGSFEQFRPRVALGEQKYVQQAGVSGLSVHPDFMDRIKGAKHLILVEGTKQHLAVVSNLKVGDDTIIAGMQGCFGWSNDSMPSTDTLGLLSSGLDQLTVLMDADLATNRDVWEAAERLGRNAAGFGVKTRYASLPAGSKVGADDLLARVWGDEPTEATRGAAAVFIRNLIDEAAEKLPRKPPAKKKKVEKSEGGGVSDIAYVDWDNATIVRDVLDVENGGRRQEVLVDAAWRIVRSRKTRDDLRGDDNAPTFDTIYDLEFARVIDDQRIEKQLHAVPFDRVEDLRWLMNATPGGYADSIRRPVRTDDLRSVGVAIMMTAPSDGAQRGLTRTGWGTYDEVDGAAAYVTTSGAITASGFTDRIVSSLDDDLSYALPNPHDITPDQAREAWEGELAFHQYWSSPEVPIMMSGWLALALTGVKPMGSMILEGQFGGGKTWTLRWLNSHTSAKDGVGGMLRGTENALSAAADGIHHGLIGLDDMRESTSARVTEGVQQAVSDLIRVAFDGPKARKGRMTSRDGHVRKIGTVRTWPCVVFSAEQLVEDSTWDSTLERTLSIHIPQGGGILRNDLPLQPEPALAEHYLAGHSHRATALYVLDLLREVELKGGGEAGITRLAAEVDGLREQWRTRLMEQHPELTPRAAGVAAGPIVGWALWLQSARRYGAIDDVERQRLLKEGIDLIVAAALAHFRRHVKGSGLRWVDAIDAIKATLASRQAAWLSDILDENDRRIVIGKGGVEAGGVRAVALIPSAVLAAVNRGRPAAQQVTEKTLARDLRPVLIPGAGSDTTRPVRINGSPQRCWVIARSTWDDPSAAAGLDDLQKSDVEVSA